MVCPSRLLAERSLILRGWWNGASALSALMAATTPSPSSPLGCDRRPSRAARTILVRDVLPILRHHSASKRSSSAKRKRPTSPGGTVEPEDATELWEVLLEHLDSNGGGTGIDDAPEKAATCLLDPRNDLFRYHEASSHARVNPAHRGNPKQRNRYKGGKTVYTCDICGKTFHTRYYLDTHMDNKHGTSLEGPDISEDASLGGVHEAQERMWVCPATALCPALGGMAECERMALATEPYYGPGSAGIGPDGPGMKLEWQRKLLEDSPSCNEDAMVESRQLCRDLFGSCFGRNDELLQEINEHVCNRLTCEDRLHGLADSLSDKLSFHHLREEWNRHHYHHGIGIWGCILVAILAIFYGGMMCGFWGGRRRQHGRSNIQIGSRRRKNGATSILRGSRRSGNQIGRMYGGGKTKDY